MARDFPDLTGDGQVTRADVLKGRGVFKRGGRVKKYAMGGKMDTKGAMGNTKTRSLGPDEEADLKALETLQQPDYDVGGPKRRFARGKVKRYSNGGSASSRADGCAVRGKTRGKMV